MGVEQGGVWLHYDNHVYRAKTKHSDVRFHKIRELLASKHILLKKVHTSDNAADMLTKQFISGKFIHFLELLNVS